MDTLYLINLEKGHLYGSRYHSELFGATLRLELNSFITKYTVLGQIELKFRSTSYFHIGPQHRQSDLTKVDVSKYDILLSRNGYTLLCPILLCCLLILCTLPCWINNAYVCFNVYVCVYVYKQRRISCLYNLDLWIWSSNVTWHLTTHMNLTMDFHCEIFK